MSGEIKRVGIFDGSLVDGFSPTSCHVLRQSRVIKAPVEKGTQSFDNKVIDPRIIKITGYVDMTSEKASITTSKIERMFQNRDFSFYGVSAKEGYFDNMILEKCNSTDHQEKFDLVEYDMEFVEAMLIQGSETGKRDSSNRNFQNSGYTPMRLITA